MGATTGIPTSFHPLVREWFLSRYGEPTPVQAQTWAKAEEGAHLLAVAPTGSGKTLAAFLGAISRFVSGDYPAGALSVLYISPLKALNEDIRRNLDAPLSELERFASGRRDWEGASGFTFPAITVASRSGDTPETERRRFLKRPPSILCTTPESLSILLDSPRARPVLASVRLLVLDEVHSVAGTKRGSLLACSIGRLALLAGEFQRIALSATVRPVDLVARFVGGYRMEIGPGLEPRYVPRQVATITPAMDKRIEFAVEWPAPAALGAPYRPSPRNSSQDPLRTSLRDPVGPDSDFSSPDATRYAAIVPAILDRISRNRSTLVFCDSRRQAERLAFLLNESGGEGTAYAHHGSLSREVRRMVESRLKSGALRCVVATASLELGIDVGSIDEVILAGAPPGVSVALQRAGRSGHAVGETSRARLYPFHGLDLLWAAAAVEGVKAGDVEETVPPLNPLDVLAQVLLALVVEEARSPDVLYGIVRSFSPFTELGREAFDSVLELLRGRYTDSRIRELEPRVHLDVADGKLHARDGMRMLLYASGGTIPDRGLYGMRLKGSGTKIGELDEEFVWERKAGDSFTFGTQSWRIVGIGPESVEVVPLGREADFMPFWRGGAPRKSQGLTDRLIGIVDRLSALGGAAREATLVSGYGFSAEAAREASRFLAAQEAVQGDVPLPGRESAAIEICADESRRDATATLVLHTLRGGRINQALAMVLSAAWEDSGGLTPETVADDEGVALFFPSAAYGDLPAGFGDDGAEACARALEAILRGLAASARASQVPGDLTEIDRLLRSRLEGSGLFAAQFRENAGRSLLLPKGMPGKRTPLWVTRLRARRLYEAVRGFSDFPVTAETWRSCFAEFFDMEGFSAWLEGIARGRILVGTFRGFAPSPFAGSAIYRTTGNLLYKGDDLGGIASSLSDRVIAEALESSRLRPQVDPALVADFVARRKRLLPGWAPDSIPDLAAWIEERVLVPEDEMDALASALPQEIAKELAKDPELGGRLANLRLPGACVPVRVHVSRLEALSAAPADFVAEWLRREGAVSPARIGEVFGLSLPDVMALTASLVEEGIAVYDRILKGEAESLLIEVDNLEILLRLGRKKSRPVVNARPPEDFFRLVSAVQGIGAGPDRGRAPDFASILDRLSGYPAPAWLWETEILPARAGDFPPSRLDALLSEGTRLWFGAGKGIIAFCPVWDYGLFSDFEGEIDGIAGLDQLGFEAVTAGGGGSALSAFGAKGEILDFWTIHDRSGLDIRATVRAIWNDVWEGRLSSEGFEALREGLRTRFGLDLPETGGGGIAAKDSASNGSLAGIPALRGAASRRIPAAMRATASMRRGRIPGLPLSGRWFSLLDGEDGGPRAQDILDLEEADRDLVRILASRYGILSRSLLEREMPGVTWKRLFPAIRRMELAGELLYGRFFEGVEGPQFMTPAALELFMNLETASPAGPFWISALDPASPAGFPFDDRPALMPARSAANRICAMSGKIVAVLSRSGKELDIIPDSRDQSLSVILAGIVSFRERLRASGGAGRTAGGRITLEKINGGPAALSPFAPAMEEAGFDRDRGKLILW